MSSPYQNSVVGCKQVIPIDLLPNSTLIITAVPNWANYRWVVQPLYGQAVNAQTTTIPEVNSYREDTDARGVFDTGWVQAQQSGYTSGQEIPSSLVNSKAWYTDRSLPIPRTLCGPVGGLPYAIPLGFDCAGILVTSFVYFGGYDADTKNITMTSADPGGLELLWLNNGYYVDTESGVMYRQSFQAPPMGNKLQRGVENLADICARLARRGGLDAADFDVSGLGDVTVDGYPIARQANAADCLRPLLQAYFAFASEYDAKLRFKYYGADADVTIDRNDLIEGNDANDGAITSNPRNQATEYPRRMVGAYMDPQQNYTAVNAVDERRAAGVIAIGDQSFEIPVVMTADTAWKATNKAMKVAYATLEGTMSYSTPFAGAGVYLSVAAGDPVLFQGKRWVADDMTIGNGSIKFETRYDRQSAYTSAAQAITGNLPAAPGVPYSGPTALIAMNLPSLRPQDTYGVYLAAASAAGVASWRGCTVQVSYDNQTSWQNATQIVEPSVFGALTANEGTGSAPELVVLVNGDLESVTDDQLAANANAFALIHSASTEIGQFKGATETATDNEYELSDVTRGGLGTTEVAAVTGDTFVMLEAVYFLPIDLSFKGKTIYFRAIGFGEIAEDASIVSIVYNPDTTVIHDGGEVTP